MNAPKSILTKSLNSPEVINQFAQDFVALQNKWSQLNSKQRISAIAEMVNKAQRSVGVPTGRIEQNAAQGHDGEFFSYKWLINISPELFNNALPNDIAEELAATIGDKLRKLIICQECVKNV
jgi:hypothetical protein